MRLAVSIACATALHGVAFGVAAIVLSGEPAALAPAPAPLDVDVVEVTPPKPAPIADSAPRPALIPARVVSLAPAHQHPHEIWPRREVAAASDPAFVDPTVAAEAPGPAVAAPPAPATPSRGPIAAAPSAGGAVPAQPRYRSNREPEYPLTSRRRHEEGVVLLKVNVQPDGLPGEISLQRSSGYDSLDRAALEEVRRSWTFDPARTAAGVPVSDTVVVHIRFSLSDDP